MTYLSHQDFFQIDLKISKIIPIFKSDNASLAHARPGHSTSHALINFVKKVANAFDCQKYFAGIFLDLSKAFDTLDHAILLSKLEACNITGTAHQWITDYFRNTIQYVQIDDSKSSALRQICGVP